MTYVFGFVDINGLDFEVKKSKVKVTVGNDPKPGDLCKYLSYFFAKIRSRMFLGLGHTNYVKRSRSQQAMTQNLVNTISQKPMKGILPKFGHSCIWVRTADYLLIT